MLLIDAIFFGMLGFFLILGSGFTFRIFLDRNLTLERVLEVFEYIENQKGSTIIELNQEAELELFVSKSDDLLLDDVFLVLSVDGDLKSTKSFNSLLSKGEHLSFSKEQNKLLRVTFNSLSKEMRQHNIKMRKAEDAFRRNLIFKN